MKNAGNTVGESGLHLTASTYHLTFSRPEDRLYLFVRDAEGVEHAFGITRHLFKRLWPALVKAIEGMSETARKASPPLQKEVIRFEQEAAVAEAKESGALSQGPLAAAQARRQYLARTVRMEESTAGRRSLALSDGANVVRIPATYEALFSFCEAVKGLVERSGWDLTLAYPWDEARPRKPAGPAAPPSSDEPPTRH